MVTMPDFGFDGVSSSLAEFMSIFFHIFFNFFFGIRVFAIKKKSTNNSIEREKGQIHSGITLTVFAMSKSPKFHHR